MTDPKITRAVALYIITEAKKIISDGWGSIDEITGEQGVGIADDLGGDTNASRFLNHCIHFVRFLSGVIRQAVIESDQETRSLGQLMTDDLGDF